MMEKYIGIIPARYQSSRFPGKALCDICGKPMIWHVYNSVMKWPKWKEVYVATDSKDIVEACAKLGIPSIMTRDDHTDCLDRAAEVVEKLEGEGRGAEKYIIVQGDEPLFNVKTLDTDLSPSVVNFYTEVQDQSELYDINAVKVVISDNKRALYFTRYTVPYHDPKTRRSDEKINFLKQIGVYVFTGEMLRLYGNLKPSSLEKAEGIGLNRLLENDIDVFMRYTEYDSVSVDTPRDQKRIIKIIEKQRGK